MKSIYNSTDTQTVDIQLGSRNLYTLFDDHEVTLKGTLTWNGNNDHITGCTLTMTNKQSDKKYKFCKIAACSVGGDVFHIMYITKGGENREDDIAITGVNIPFSQGDKYALKFKIHDGCPEIYNCLLDGGDPDTKDGTILVGKQ